MNLRRHWILYFLYWLLGIVVGGALLGATMFPVLGPLFGSKLGPLDHALAGAHHLGFIALIWAPGIALVACVIRARRNQNCFQKASMHSLISKLLPGPVITDGAWGTQLQAQGLGAGECPDLWNLSHPDRVEKVARAYVDAGSEVILTNTFGATRVRLADHDAGDKAAAINKAGVEISKRAAAGRALVFASVGPTGKMLAMGEVSEDELRANFTEQINALAGAGADAILLETFADLDETRIAIAAAKATGLPVIASLVYDSGAQRDRTMMGATPEEAAAALAEAGADVIGANCGRGIEGYLAIAKRLRAATTLPVWIKANAGLPEIVGGKTVYPANPLFFADKAAEVVAAGANFIGGCCGTSPEFIAAIAKKFGRK